MSTEETELRRPTLSIREAAAACNVSRITVRRRLDDDQFPNAFKSTDRQPQWRIPVGDLIAAGLSPNAYSNDVEPEPDSRDEGTRLRDELSAAQQTIARLVGEKQLAQALAEERAQSLADLRQALKMLESAPPVVAQIPRRRWFGRKPKVTAAAVGERPNNTDGI